MKRRPDGRCFGLPGGIELGTALMCDGSAAQGLASAAGVACARRACRALHRWRPASGLAVRRPAARCVSLWRLTRSQDEHVMQQVLSKPLVGAAGANCAQPRCTVLGGLRAAQTPGLNCGCCKLPKKIVLQYRIQSSIPHTGKQHFATPYEAFCSNMHSAIDM